MMRVPQLNAEEEEVESEDLSDASNMNPAL